MKAFIATIVSVGTRGSAIVMGIWALLGLGASMAGHPVSFRQHADMIALSVAFAWSIGVSVSIIVNVLVHMREAELGDHA